MIKDSAIGSKDYLDALFEASNDVIIVLSEDHLIVKSNPAFDHSFPAPASHKINSTSFSSLIGNVSYNKIFKPTLEACIEKNKKATISKWSEHKGTRKFFQWTFLPLPTTSSMKPGVLAIAKDLSELQKLKEYVLQKDMELKSLIQSKTDCIYFVNRSKFVFDCNNLGLEFAKRNSNNTFFIGDSVFDFVTEKYRKTLSLILDEVLTKEIEIKRQKYYPKSDIYYEFTFKPIRELSGNVAGVVIIAADITSGKIAEREMHLSRNKLKALFDSSIQSIFLLGKNYEILEFNRRASDAINKIWNKNLHIGDSILDYFLDAIHEQFLEYFNKALEGEKNVFEQQINYPNGLKIWSEITFVPVYNMEGEIFGVSFSTLDITERKMVEAKLGENEANLLSLIENNNALIWSVDKEYRLILHNTRFKEFFESKYKFTPVAGSSILNHLDAETSIFFKNLFDKAYRGNFVKKDFEMLLPTGKVIVEIVMNPIISNNKIIGASVFAVDITDRKYREIELEQLNSSYRQEIEIRKKIEEDLKFKNNELDTFIYKASHDLRGPIASLMGLYNAATIEIKDAKSLEYLEYINKTAQRMDQVLKALISLSDIKDRPVDVEVTKLNSIVKDAMDILESKNSLNDIDFKINVPEISFYTDAGLLMVIIKNLLENAIRYSRLTIKSVIKVKGEQLSDKQVLITISDNGLGMHPQIQDKVFNMFYKGNNLSPGSGLGLYMVKSAAYKLGGKITLKSAVNKGTTFQVQLPDMSTD